MVRPRSIAAIVLSATLLFTAAACSNSDGDDTSSPDDKVEADGGGENDVDEMTGKGPEGSGPAPESVTVALRLDVDSFDPQRSLGDSAAGQTFMFLYDTMVRRTIDGDIVPGAAESWEMTPSSGVFKIRDGLTCSDGTPLDATAIAASFKELGDNPAAMGKTKIFGPDGMKSATADADANTVTIETNSPNNEMLTGLAVGGHIVCPAGLADTDALRQAPQGSGPYELTDSRRGDQYTLTLRDDYVAYPEGTTADDMPRTVVLKVITEDPTGADLVESGKVQIVGLHSNDANRLLDNDALVSVPAPGYNTNAVLFTQKPGFPTADEKLRQGMAMLLDSTQGAAAETQGMGIARRTLYTPNVSCYNPDAENYAPAFDPDAAASFLDDAGYTTGADGKRTRPDGSKLTIRVVGNNTQGQMPQFIADSLERGGFDVDLFVGTYNESIQKLLQDEFDMGTYPFTDTAPLPIAWQSQIGSEASSNFGKVNNETFDELAQEALAVDLSVDPEGACQKWQEAEKSVLEAANVVPTVQPVNYWFGNGVTFDASYFRIDPFSIRSR